MAEQCLRTYKNVFGETGVALVDCENPPEAIKGGKRDVYPNGLEGNSKRDDHPEVFTLVPPQVRAADPRYIEYVNRPKPTNEQVWISPNRPEQPPQNPELPPNYPTRPLPPPTPRPEEEDQFVPFAWSHLKFTIGSSFNPYSRWLHIASKVDVPLFATKIHLDYQVMGDKWLQIHPHIGVKIGAVDRYGEDPKNPQTTYTAYTPFIGAKIFFSRSIPVRLFVEADAGWQLGTPIEGFEQKPTIDAGLGLRFLAWSKIVDWTIIHYSRPILQSPGSTYYQEGAITTGLSFPTGL